MASPRLPFSSWTEPLLTLHARNAATLWLSRRNTSEIAAALKITEPEAQKLLDRARHEEMLP
jgi:DNA-binding transcriptional regulator LsrR (DeoR family)